MPELVRDGFANGLSYVNLRAMDRERVGFVRDELVS